MNNHVKIHLELRDCSVCLFMEDGCLKTEIRNGRNQIGGASRRKEDLDQFIADYQHLLELIDWTEIDAWVREKVEKIHD